MSLSEMRASTHHCGRSHLHLTISITYTGVPGTWAFSPCPWVRCAPPLHNRGRSPLIQIGAPKENLSKWTFSFYNASQWLHIQIYTGECSHFSSNCWNSSTSWSWLQGSHTTSCSQWNAVEAGTIHFLSHDAIVDHKNAFLVSYSLVQAMTAPLSLFLFLGQ